MDVFVSWVKENADTLRQLAVNLGMSQEELVKTMLDDVLEAYTSNELVLK